MFTKYFSNFLIFFKQTYPKPLNFSTKISVISKINHNKYKIHPLTMLQVITFYSRLIIETPSFNINLI